MGMKWQEIIGEKLSWPNSVGQLNLCLPRRIKTNRVDVRSIIENGLKTQGPN